MHTPKNFALQLGALIALYISLTSLITLLFSVLTVALPDSADSYYTTESATETIRFSIATLVVFFPVYLWLTRRVNEVRRHEEDAYLTLTKWLTYLSLLVGGGVLLGDVVAVILGFLNGELTTRFLFKALILGGVIAAAFYYYLKDAQGYWQTHEKESKLFGLGAIALVVGSLVFGFVHNEPPQEIREMRIDTNQIADLQDMQQRIEQHYRINETLPETIEIVYVGQKVPRAPEGRSEYEYTPTGDTTYELCATFSADSSQNGRVAVAPVFDANYNWSHSEGRWCFERTTEQSQR